jgi:protein-S-isoprenylcysteine O-methyltransferase Ste14
LLIVAAEVVVLSAIEVAFITKHLSGRAVGLAGLLNMAAFFVAFLLFFRKAREKTHADEASLGPTGAIEAQSQRLRRGIKACKRLMAMFAIFLVFGELANSDSPAWVKVSGAIFDLGLIALFYWSMRRSQAKLKLLGEPS